MIVIKYGGHALPEPGAIDPALELIAHEFTTGEEIVIVHGGGPQINAALALRGLGKEMIGGYRKTSPEVFEVVQEVLSGQVLRSIVNQLGALGVNAVGLSAADGETVRAEKMLVTVDGTPTDIGLVGEVISTNPALLRTLIAEGYLPVISPIGVSIHAMQKSLKLSILQLYTTDVCGNKVLDRVDATTESRNLEILSENYRTFLDLIEYPIMLHSTRLRMYIDAVKRLGLDFYFIPFQAPSLDTITTSQILRKQLKLLGDDPHATHLLTVGKVFIKESPRPTK